MTYAGASAQVTAMRMSEKRYGRATTAVLAFSVSVALEEYPDPRQPQDLEVPGQGPVLAVVGVVERPVADGSGPSQVVDLRPPGEAGPDPLPLQVARHVHAVLLIEEGRLRARPDQAHVALEDVDQLRQLVQTHPPQDSPEPGGARVARLRDHRSSSSLGVRDHGSKLVDREWSAIHADALLPEQHRTTRRGDLDQGRDHQQEWAENEQHHRADREIQRRLDHAVGPAQPVPPDTDQGHPVDRVYIDASAHHVQEVGHDLELELLILADLDQAHQLGPIAPWQRQEYLVGV